MNPIDPAAGQAAKDQGMAAADTNTPADWATRCDDAIRTMAARGVTFQASDLIEQGLIDEPEKPCQWGPRFYAARLAGVIAEAGYAPSKRATVHRSICRQWIGSQTARSAA